MYLLKKRPGGVQRLWQQNEPPSSWCTDVREIQRRLKMAWSAIHLTVISHSWVGGEP